MHSWAQTVTYHSFSTTHQVTVDSRLEEWSGRSVQSSCESNPRPPHNQGCIRVNSIICHVLQWKTSSYQATKVHSCIDFLLEQTTTACFLPIVVVRGRSRDTCANNVGWFSACLPAESMIGLPDGRRYLSLLSSWNPPIPS
jgi:hypothetical protein